MAGSSVKYMIDLIVNDQKLRQQMAKWDWESIIGASGKDFGDVLLDQTTDGTKKVKNTLKDLHIDWGQMFDDKQIKHLEQNLARAIQSSKNKIKLLANEGDTAGIEKVMETLIGLGKEFQAMGSNFNADQLARSMNSFMTAISTDKIAKFVANTEDLIAAFDKLFNGRVAYGVNQTVSQIATAMAKLGVDKSVVTDMKQVRTEMEKLAKNSKITLDVDYTGLNDEDLLAALRNKHGQHKMGLEDLLNFEWSSEIEALADAGEDGIKKTITNILALESKIKSITGKSPVDDDFFDITGYDFEDLQIKLDSLVSKTEESIEKTIEKLDKGVKDVQTSITEKLGKLSEVEVGLTLDEKDKAKFKTSIDNFVEELNADKYGEIKHVNVDLDLNEPDKTTKRGRPKSASKEQIEKTKTEIQQALDAAKEEYATISDVLDNQENGLRKKFEAEPKNGHLASSIKKAEEELKYLEKTMASYNYMLVNMDDYDTAKAITTDWKKFSSMAMNIRQSQEELLRKTRQWRTDMNDALKFRYQWNVEGTEAEFDRLAFDFEKMADENPLKLKPDIEFMVKTIEEGLSGREINVKLSADGPIKATGGVVGNVGFVPVATTNRPVAQVKPAPKPQPIASQPQVQQPAQPENVQTHVYIDAATNAMIEFVEAQVEAAKDLEKLYAEMLKDVGITDRGVAAYLKNVRDGKAEVSDEVAKKYGSADLFVQKLRKTKEQVNFNKKLPFFGVTQDILGLKDVIANNSDDEEKVKRASEQIKALLIKSIVDSFKNYNQKSKADFSENTKEIQEWEKQRDAARKAYSSDSEKKKRLDVIDAQKQKVADINSNTAIAEYELLLQLIREAQRTGDQESLTSFLEQERKTLPAVKKGYEDLVAARDKLRELEKGDPDDTNFQKILEAEKEIATLAEANRKITLRRQAYGNIGIPFDELEQLINEEKSNEIYDFIVNKILSKPDVVQSMGAKRKLPGGETNSFELFSTTHQKLMTATIDMVQKALNLTRQTTEELDRRAENEGAIRDLKNVAKKRTVLSDIDREAKKSLVFSEDTLSQARSLFASELDHARSVGEKGAKNARERAYVQFAQTLDEATQAASEFRDICGSWSKFDEVSLTAAEDKQAWFHKKYSDPVDADSKYAAYVRNNAAKQALVDAILPKQPTNGTGGSSYNILDEITGQLKGYVFRVTLVDDKGAKTVGVGTDKLVKRGELDRPDETRVPGSYNMAKFVISLPEDLSEIAGIQFYKIPGKRGTLNQPSNVERPTRSIEQKQERSQAAAEARRKIKLANKVADESKNAVTAKEELDAATEVMKVAEGTLVDITNRITSMTGGADVQTYVEELKKKRNELLLTSNGQNNGGMQQVKPLSNEVFDKAGEIVATAIEAADIAQKIAQNPFDAEVQKLFKGELPDGLRRLSDIVAKRESLNKVLPQSQEEAIAIQAELQDLFNEEKSIKQSIRQWANNIVANKDGTIASADKMKEQAAPTLAKAYQKELVGLVDQAMSLTQQLEANPNNKELKTQMQGIVDIISQLVVYYNELLEKYNVTTKGFLGNENAQKYKNALQIYNNPGDKQLLSYLELWGGFDSIPDAVYKRDELVQKESELMKLIPTLPEDQREVIEAERRRIAAEYSKENDKVLQWVNRQGVSIGTGIFAGLGNRGQKFKALQGIMANWIPSTSTTATSQIDARHERLKIGDDISTLNTLERQKEAQAQIVANAKERLSLAQRQLVIEQELADTNITAERRAELEGEKERSKARAIELGARSRKFAIPANVSQNDYLEVINELIDQQEESDRRVADLRTRIENKKETRDRLKAPRTPDKVAEGKRRTQDRVISREISFMASKLAETEPDIYAALLEEAEEKYPITDFLDHMNPYEHQERKIAFEMQKMAEDYVRTMMTPEKEQKIIDDVVASQEEQIKEDEKLLQAEIERNNAIVAQRDKYKLEGQITDEMIAARRGTTEEIMREGKVVRQHTDSIPRTIESTDYTVYDTPLLEDDDISYQNYPVGQTYQYGSGVYGVDVSGLATEDTLWKIYQLLSGDTSERGLSGSERRALETELEAIRGQLGGLGRNDGMADDLRMSEEAERAAKILHNALSNIDVRHSSVESLTDVYKSLGKEVLDAEQLLKDPKYQGPLEVAQLASWGLEEFPDVDELLARLKYMRAKVGHDTIAGIDASRGTSVSQLDVKSHLYNQFVDWLAQIAKETFNITDLPIDKFKDVIENIWIPEALKHGATDISQLGMQRTSGQYLIENRLGARMPQDVADRAELELLRDSLLQNELDFRNAKSNGKESLVMFGDEGLVEVRESVGAAISEELIDKVLKETAGTGVLGSLHNHPNGMGAPSISDLQTWFDKFAQMGVKLNGILTSFGVMAVDFSDTDATVVDKFINKYRELVAQEETLSQFITVNDKGGFKWTDEASKIFADPELAKDFEPTIRASVNYMLQDALREALKYAGMKDLVLFDGTNGILDFAKFVQGVNSNTTQAPKVAEPKTKETVDGLMDLGKAINIINKAIGGSTATTQVGMAKAYANKIHGNEEITAAARRLYQAQDHEFTSGYGRSLQKKLRDFHGAWRNSQQKEQPKVIVEPEIPTAAVAQEVQENVNQTPVEIPVTPTIVQKTLPNGSTFEGTEQEYNDLMAWMSGESVEVDVKPTVQPGAVDQAIDEDITNNSPDVSIVKATLPDGSSFEGTEQELQAVLAMFDEPIEAMVDASNQQVVNEQKKSEETAEQLANEKVETAESTQQFDNTAALKAREAEINAQLLADDQLRATQSSDKTTSGGIVGTMNTLAKDSTLHDILTAIGDIAKRQLTYVSGKGNSAQDLLMRIIGLRDVSKNQDKERVAYMDLNTGAITDSVEGRRGDIEAKTLEILRQAYQGYIDLNAQLHTHGDSNNPEDQYFSAKDFATFKADFDKGIKKQILVSMQGLSVLDLSDVQELSEDTLIKLGGGKSAYEAMLNNDFGARYVTQGWEGITPQSLVKLLGIKGIESKYTIEETRDLARQGITDADEKEAASMVQESTGRSFKKAVERYGVNLETITEKTDAKGNKTWSSEINDKVERALKETHANVMEQNLGSVFGEDTEASKAFAEYTTQYDRLLDLINRFKANPKEDGLQKEINDVLPLLDKASDKLDSLITRKDRFTDGKDIVATFSQDQLGDTKTNLHNLAVSKYSGQNIAFNGLRGTNNGTELLVDVLHDGVITQYALEVDKATGQVRELMAAENALANAFQNVNKAMKQNETVQANVAIGDNVRKQEQFMEDASSPEWNAYKKALADMETYVANAWAKIQRSIQHGKGRTTFSEEELDYIMALSEKVIALGKDVQKTSIAFKNFWAQNPDDVTALKIRINGDGAVSRDEQVRVAMEQFAQNKAVSSNEAYEFINFDNDKLNYKLTDVEGNVRKVTLVWNELYKQIAMVSNQSVATIDPMVSKIQQYDEAIQKAVDDGYLSGSDSDFANFKATQQAINNIVQSVKDGTTSYEEQKDVLDKLRQSAVDYGAKVGQNIKKNQKLYVGTNEVRSVDRQRDRIIGAFGSVDTFNDSDVKLVQRYKDAYAQLHATYDKFAKEQTLHETNNQEQLRQQATSVQLLGRKLLTAMSQADQLKQKVEQSGFYTDDKGVDHALGGTKTLEAKDVSNLDASMRAYAESVYGANIENIKINRTTNTLTGTIRTSKESVADVAVQYNSATRALYAYNKQERESLTGFPAFMKGMKAKIGSLLQYTMGITSIHSALSEVRRGIQYVREIDQALTELKKVTDETNESYQRFLETASKTASKVGTTIAEVVRSTADWSRLGYSMEDAATLAESTAVLLNVSEFQSIEDATSALTSTLQAFGYVAEDSMHVVDVMNEVGNNYAVSSAGIATALQDSASSLMAANNSYQESVALIAAANRVVILRHGL